MFENKFNSFIEDKKSEIISIFDLSAGNTFITGEYVDIDSLDDDGLYNYISINILNILDVKNHLGYFNNDRFLKIFINFINNNKNYYGMAQSKINSSIIGLSKRKFSNYSKIIDLARQFNKYYLDKIVANCKFCDLLKYEDLDMLMSIIFSDNYNFYIIDTINFLKDKNIEVNSISVDDYIYIISLKESISINYIMIMLEHINTKDDGINDILLNIIGNIINELSNDNFNALAYSITYNTFNIYMNESFKRIVSMFERSNRMYIEFKNLHQII